MNEIKTRLKSKVVWASILAQILLIVVLVNPQVADKLKIVGGALIEIATMFGVLNDPSQNDRF